MGLTAEQDAGPSRDPIVSRVAFSYGWVMALVTVAWAAIGTGLLSMPTGPLTAFFGRAPRGTPGGIIDFQRSPDGGLLLTTHDDGHATLRGFDDGMADEVADVRGAAFSLDGRHVAFIHGGRACPGAEQGITVLEGAQLTVVDVRSGERTALFTGGLHPQLSWADEGTILGARQHGDSLDVFACDLGAKPVPSRAPARAIASNRAGRFRVLKGPNESSPVASALGLRARRNALSPEGTAERVVRTQSAVLSGLRLSFAAAIPGLKPLGYSHGVPSGHFVSDHPFGAIALGRQQSRPRRARPSLGR